MKKGHVRGIKELREARGLTQMDVAKACDVSLVTIQKWDKAIGGVRLDHLVKLSRCLGISCDELCGLTDPTEPWA